MDETLLTKTPQATQGFSFRNPVVEADVLNGSGLVLRKRSRYTTEMRVLIVGCGYVGCSVGAELVRLGHQVYGLRRSPEAHAALKSAGIEPLTVDVTDSVQLGTLTPDYDWVVNVVSSSKGGVFDYQRVYRDGTKNLIEWLKGGTIKRFVYTSSTGVYGQTDGSLVKESSPTEPLVETSKVLVETENLLLAAARDSKFPAVILRVAGIYGPDRGHYFKQYLKNEAKISGRGDRILNMIHLDDLAAIVIQALKNGRVGEVYNAVDDEPVMQIHFFRWLSETLGKWMPPAQPENIDEERKRGATSKKVSNRKLKMELGYQFRFPTFRQGYTAEIQRLERAGLLNIEAEPR